MSEIEAREERKVWWHSRRGMLELDLILLPFVEARFSTLDPDSRAAYLKLLEQEDQDLYRWLIGSHQPEADNLRAIIALIREFNSAQREP